VEGRSNSCGKLHSLGSVINLQPTQIIGRGAVGLTA
jgi:hypothetical protein